MDEAGGRHPRADPPVLNSSPVTVSEYILQTLEMNGINVTFGLPGVHALGIWNALKESSLGYVGFRHEQAAAHAADGAGRVTGRPGVVFLSTGPGELNALSALGEAYVSSSPVLAISSQIPTNLVGKGKGFLHESKDLLLAADRVARYTARAASASDIPDILGQAIEASTSRRHGPAFIEIPMDLFDAELDAKPFRVESDPVDPPADLIEEASLLLSLAARPVIWAGGGVVRSGASAELTALAEKLRAPVVTTFMGKGAISEEHPLSAWPMVRQPEIQRLLADADLMLAIGTRFSAMTTGNWRLEPPSQLIHVDIDPDEIGRNYPVRLGITADARLALKALTSSLDNRSTQRGVLRAIDADRSIDWTTRARAMRDVCLGRAREEGPREMSMLDAIRRAIPPEVPMVHDMTIASYWSAPFLPVTQPRTFLYPYGFGSLGFSFPAALGVAAATAPDPVVCFTGDGGFQYHLRELATAKQYGLNVTVLLFNDEAWGVLKAFSTARYDHNFGMDLSGPNFVKLGEAYGVPTAKAVEPDQVMDALTRSLSEPGPSVIEIPGSWRLPPPSEYYR